MIPRTQYRNQKWRKNRTEGKENLQTRKHEKTESLTQRVDV